MRKAKRILVAGDDMCIRDATNGDVIVATMESSRYASVQTPSIAAVQRDHVELARVMAAAPEMLTMLKSVMREMKPMRCPAARMFGKNANDDDKTRKRIQAVIRKAEGK